MASLIRATHVTRGVSERLRVFGEKADVRQMDAEKLDFPDATFDFVCATSVFTHMLPAGVANYLREIRRVLRPGGRCLATFFVLRSDLTGPGSYLHFAHDAGGCHATRSGNPRP